VYIAGLPPSVRRPFSNDDVERQDMQRLLDRLRTLAAPLGDRSVRRLWYSMVFSEAGDWAARLALGLLVFAQTGSPLAVGAVTAVSLLPYLGVGQLLGTLADRFPHRTVMVAADVARGVLYLFLATTDLSVPAVLAVAFLAGLADPPYGAANFAAMPQLAGERYLVVQTLFASTRQLVALVGFAAGGLLVAATSPAVALGVNAVTFFLAAALTGGIRSTRSGAPGERRPLLRPAVRALTSDRLVVVAASVVTVSAVLGVTVESLIVAYAAHLGFGAAGAGLLATVPLVAAIASALMLPSEGEHTWLVRVVCWTVGGMSAVASLVFAFDSPMPIVLIAFLAVGALEVMTVPAGVVIGQRLPQASRGTAFSFLEGALMVAQAAGALLAGSLAVATSVPTATALFALPGMVIAVIGLLVVGRRSAPVPAPLLPVSVGAVPDGVPAA
jgi:MFS family permease